MSVLGLEEISYRQPDPATVLGWSETREVVQGPEVAACSRNSVSCLDCRQPKSAGGRIRLLVSEVNSLLRHLGRSISNLVFPSPT